MRTPAIVKSYGGLVIPPSGIYLGAEDADTDRNFIGPKGIETQLGRTMAIRRRHYAWLANYPTQFEKDNVARGIIPMVCQSGAGNFPKLTEIAAGKFDHYFLGRALGLKALKAPVLYNLFYEFNGSHNPYFGGNQGGVGSEIGRPGLGEAAYQHAWQRIWNVFLQAGATLSSGGNVIFCWTSQGPTTQGFYQNYWPGSPYVDWVGTDLYRSTFASRCTNKGTYNGGTGSQDYYLFAQTHRKPFFIAESGLRDGQSVPDVALAGGDGLHYDKDGHVTGHSAIAKLMADMKKHQDCVAYVHWNEKGDPSLSGTGNYVDSTHESLGQYRHFYADPYGQLHWKHA